MPDLKKRTRKSEAAPLTTPADYASLLGEVKTRIRAEALGSVNRELERLNWDVGRMIVERQRDEEWGRAVVERLAAELQAEFPGVRGFSAHNIRYMRQFYLAYRDSEKLQPLVAEIGWTHNLILMERCKDDLEREFYTPMTGKFDPSKNVLIRHVENRTYERTLTSQTNFDQTVTDEIREDVKLAVRDEYTFDLLDLGDEYGRC